MRELTARSKIEYIGGIAVKFTSGYCGSERLDTKIEIKENGKEWVTLLWIAGSTYDAFVDEFSNLIETYSIQ